MSFSGSEHTLLKGRLVLLLLALALLILWFFSGGTLTGDERQLRERVIAAEQHLAQWRAANGSLADEKDDPAGSGLIGVEWSPVTTTLGDLEAKRISTNPLWAVQFLRWYQQLQLHAGDSVVISSSGSFPGLLLSALLAAEEMDLGIHLFVSLGASTYGANHPDALWPMMARTLREKGLLHTKAELLTLGGGSEMGQGLAPEGLAILRRSIAESGVTSLAATDIMEMIRLKSEVAFARKPRLFINIGGSHANLGVDDAILSFPVGLNMADNSLQAGNGVIGNMIAAGVPVIHMLHLKELAIKVGIAAPTVIAGGMLADRGTGWAILALILFFLALWRHQRWQFV